MPQKCLVGIRTGTPQRLRDNFLFFFANSNATPKRGRIQLVIFS